jgi:hypothetical protein
MNLMAVLATQHGYSMAAMDNGALITLYSKLQETIKSQADSLFTMQGQQVNIQQFYMTVSPQPPSNV